MLKVHEMQSVKFMKNMMIVLGVQKLMPHGVIDDK